jgi:hypothetical protein
VDYFLVLNRELVTYKLSEMEWSILQDFEVILEVCTSHKYPGMHFDKKYQVPHMVQQVMSGEATPILAGAIPAFEMFMTQWENLGAKHPTLTPWISIGLEYTTTYYARMDRTCSYIIVMGKLHDLLTLAST